MNILDRGGLIRESYRIEGISVEECRSIFMDWAIKLPAEQDQKAAIELLLKAYGLSGHPMTAILREGLNGAKATGRRGGAKARRG
jgi:hypothetical protein